LKVGLTCENAILKSINFQKVLALKRLKDSNFFFF